MLGLRILKKHKSDYLRDIRASVCNWGWSCDVGELRESFLLAMGLLFHDFNVKPILSGFTKTTHVICQYFKAKQLTVVMMLLIVFIVF